MGLGRGGALVWRRAPPLPAARTICFVCHTRPALRGSCCILAPVVAGRLAVLAVLTPCVLPRLLAAGTRCWRWMRTRACAWWRRFCMNTARSCWPSCPTRRWGAAAAPLCTQHPGAAKVAARLTGCAQQGAQTSGQDGARRASPPHACPHALLHPPPPPGRPACRRWSTCSPRPSAAASGRRACTTCGGSWHARRCACGWLPPPPSHPPPPPPPPPPLMRLLCLPWHSACQPHLQASPRLCSSALPQPCCLFKHPPGPAPLPCLSPAACPPSLGVRRPPASPRP